MRTPRAPFRRILHPSDFSPASRRAFALAVDLARRPGAALVVLHVVVPVVQMPEVYLAATTTYEKFQESLRAASRKRLDALVARAKAAGARASGLLLQGVPADQILRTARATRADVIVMGTHGRSGLARVVVGSVAERVVTLAARPVLTVRARR